MYALRKRVVVVYVCNVLYFLPYLKHQPLQPVLRLRLVTFRPLTFLCLIGKLVRSGWHIEVLDDIPWLLGMPWRLLSSCIACVRILNNSARVYIHMCSGMMFHMRESHMPLYQDESRRCIVLGYDSHQTPVHIRATMFGCSGWYGSSSGTRFYWIWQHIPTHPNTSWSHDSNIS